MNSNPSTESIQWLQSKLGNEQEVILRDISSKVQFICIESLIDSQKINELLLKPFFNMENEKEYEEYIISLPGYRAYVDDKQALNEIMFGFAVIRIESRMHMMDVRLINNSSIAEATVETVIEGPQNALSEDISTNINLIRQRYRQVSLQMEKLRAGRLSQTELALIYDEKLVDNEILEQVRLSLDQLDIEVLLAAGQLQNKLNKGRKGLFPTIMITERPDRIAFNIGQGKVVLLIDGTLFALVLPAVFYDFMSSMEDIYQSFWVSRFLLSLRYLGLLINLILPAAYVAITAYNPEVFRVQLILSVSGSRTGVPFPAFVEVLFMLLMMELLTEASIRLPKSIGSTATTVGGLILGQAATEAALVSNIMIIIVAAVAISNFAIPINAMSFTMRFVKYLLLICSIFLGLVGVVVGLLAIIAYLVNLESFGKPYFKLFFIPLSKESKGLKKEGGS